MYRVLAGLVLVMLFSWADISCNSNRNHPQNDTGNVKEDTSISGRITSVTTQINASPSNPDLYESRAKLFIQLGKSEEALQDMYRSLYIDSMRISYYQTLADIYTATGKGEMAFLSLEKGNMLHPEDHKHAIKTATYALYLKKYEQGLSTINSILKQDPFDPEAYFIKAMIYKDQGVLLKAMSSLQTCVEQDPQHFEAYMQLGLIGMKLKDKHAEDYLNNAISINEKSPVAWNAKGTYFLEQDKIKEALNCFRKATILDSKIALAQYNVGYCLFVLDSFDQAYISFSNAIESNPEYAEAYYNRGLCAIKKSDVLDAQFNFEQAKKYKPGWTKPQEQLDKINKR